MLTEVAGLESQNCHNTSTGAQKSALLFEALVVPALPLLSSSNLGKGAISTLPMHT